MTVTIDRKLNLVVPLVRGDETKLYVHSEPLLRQTFEFYYLALSRTFAQLAQHGLDPRSGPSVASFVLKDVALNTPRLRPGEQIANWWDGQDGVGGSAGLLAEITRLSNVLVPTTDKGWAHTPLQTAIDQRLISEGEKAEVLSLLTFFTVISWAAPWADRDSFVKGTAFYSSSEATYSSATDYANFLKISTTAAATDENAKV